jgi:hypothetical protein
MKHPSTREFFAYWDEKRGGARAPDRSEIEPGAVRELLGDIFVLAYDAASGYPFRVAGTRVCALLGGDLKDRSFSALFTPDARREIEDIIAVVSEEMLAAVAGITATAQDGSPAGIAAVAVQRPRPRAAEPDRIAGAVRKRPQPAAGLQIDLVPLSRPPAAAEARSPRAAQTGGRARLHGL